MGQRVPHHKAEDGNHEDGAEDEGATDADAQNGDSNEVHAFLGPSSLVMGRGERPLDSSPMSTR